MTASSLSLLFSFCGTDLFFKLPQYFLQACYHLSHGFYVFILLLSSLKCFFHCLAYDLNLIVILLSVHLLILLVLTHFPLVLTNVSVLALNTFSTVFPVQYIVSLLQQLYFTIQNGSACSPLSNCQTLLFIIVN